MASTDSSITLIIYFFFSIEDLLKPVSVGFPDDYSADDLTGEDKWICMANCLHLAAKYFPGGLQIILSYFDQIQRKELAEMDQYSTQKAKHCSLRKLIQRAHENECFSPLHVASSNTSSLSTR